MNALDWPGGHLHRRWHSDDAVVEFWNNLDSELEFPLDVLDDVCAESKEVYQCGNRYGPNPVFKTKTRWDQIPISADSTNSEPRKYFGALNRLGSVWSPPDPRNAGIRFSFILVWSQSRHIPTKTTIYLYLD